MTQQQNTRPQKPAPTSSTGWISELALADAYHISRTALHKLLRRAGIPYKKAEHTTPTGSRFFRIYWPAHLHPQARIIEK